jgi:hypothetical protein
VKSKHVGYVLIALIVIGVAGLVVRFVAAGSDELVLSGLLPISQDVVTKVTIASGEKQTELTKDGDVWRAENYPAFVPKLNQFWTAVSDIDGAQLVATNPANHARMGVDRENGNGIKVSFFLGPAIQEEFTVGTWSPNVGMCYLRRAGKDDVYGIPCPAPAQNIFDPDLDGWRNPIIVSIPRTEIESILFEYPNEQFLLTVRGGQWIVDSGAGVENPADRSQVEFVLAAVELFFASGFVEESVAKDIDFDLPAVRINTTEESDFPATRLRFAPAPGGSFYVRTPNHTSVFIIDPKLAGALLQSRATLTFQGGG